MSRTVTDRFGEEMYTTITKRGGNYKNYNKRGQTHGFQGRGRQTVLNIVGEGRNRWIEDQQRTEYLAGRSRRDVNSNKLRRTFS